MARPIRQRGPSKGLNCEVHQEAVLAVGSGVADGIAVLLAKSFVALVGGLGVSLLVFLIVIFHRDRSRREIRALGLQSV